MDNHIQLFEHNEIRSVWHDDQEEWLFSIIDVVRALTGSNNPRRYWSDLKRKIAQEGGGGGSSTVRKNRTVQITSPRWKEA